MARLTAVLVPKGHKRGLGHGECLALDAQHSWCIGSDPKEADIVLPCAFVQGRHAELRLRLYVYIHLQLNGRYGYAVYSVSIAEEMTAFIMHTGAGGEWWGGV